MKKQSLVLALTLILAHTTTKCENNTIAYSLFAAQAGGALYAITGIQSLLATETPTNKEVTPKKALEARIKKAKDENKVWIGISIFLTSYLAQAAVNFVSGVGAGIKVASTK
jgi:hypothetical protein